VNGKQMLKMQWCNLNNLLIMEQKQLEEAKALVEQKEGKVAELNEKMDELDKLIKKLED